jgi:Fic family protein
VTKFGQKMENKLAFDVPTSQKLFAKAARIDQFKGRWKLLEQKENRYLKELRTLATIQSIGSSTRIEGSTMSNSEVENLMKITKITKFVTRDEQEVAGYFDVVTLVLDQYSFIEFSLNNIKSLHNQLLKYSEKDEKHKGEFKKFTNKVVATYPDGSQKTIFNTTEPFFVDKEMTEMVDWVNEKLGNPDFHPLFVIGAAIYEFLSIHPFQDGNGRLSRLLTSLLLLREGYDFVQYISFEHIIEAKKAEYYRSLIAAQQKRGTENEIISEWLLFFMSGLEELIQKLEEKYTRYLKIGGFLNVRQQKLLEILRDKKVFRLAEIENLFSEISNRTLIRDLKLLESERFLEKTGRGNAVVYQLL